MSYRNPKIVSESKKDINLARLSAKKISLSNPNINIYPTGQVVKKYGMEYKISDTRKFPLGIVPFYSRLILENTKYSHSPLSNIEGKFKGLETSDGYFLDGPFEVSFNTKEFNYKIFGNYDNNLLNGDYFLVYYSAQDSLIIDLEYYFFNKGYREISLKFEYSVIHNKIIITDLIKEHEYTYTTPEKFAKYVDGKIIINMDLIDKVLDDLYPLV